MLFNELIANEFSKLLGANYKVYLNDAFQKDYTTVSAAGLDIRYDAFDKYANTAVVVFSSAPIEIINAEKKIFQASYKLQFWIPLDTWQIAEDGTTVSGFDFYADAETLINTLNTTPLTLTDSTKTYTAYFTAGEPVLASPVPDASGAYKRGIYEINGIVSAGDTAMRTGADIEVSFTIGGTEVKIDEMANINIQSNTTSNLIIDTATLSQKQEPASIGQSISFLIMDKTTTNAARLLIANKAFKNLEILTSDASTTENKRKIFVKLYKASTLQSSFWGTLSVTYTSTGKTGFGQYEVSIVNAGV